jgi:hypothetical protein
VTLDIALTTPNNSTSGNESVGGGAIKLVDVNPSINKQGPLATFNPIAYIYFKFKRYY